MKRATILILLIIGYVSYSCAQIQRNYCFTIYYHQDNSKELFIFPQKYINICFLKDFQYSISLEDFESDDMLYTYGLFSDSYTIENDTITCYFKDKEFMKFTCQDSVLLAQEVNLKILKHKRGVVAYYAYEKNVIDLNNIRFFSLINNDKPFNNGCFLQLYKNKTFQYLCGQQVILEGEYVYQNTSLILKDIHTKQIFTFDTDCKKMTFKKLLLYPIWQD